MIKKTEAGAEISKSTVVRGRVQGAEALSVAGRIEGSISLDAKLTIEKSGIVKADVDAEEVIVRGVLVGDVKARKTVRLEAGARVKGDIDAPAIVIVEGAQFSGGLTIGDTASQAERAASGASEVGRAGFARPGPDDRIPEPSPAPLRYEPERVAPTEVIMRPVVEDRHKRRIVVKKRS
jgi:cytoskeletal protein CcmA (bactofilin family)